MDIEAEYEEYISEHELKMRDRTRLHTVIGILKQREIPMPVLSEVKKLRHEVIVPQVMSEQSVTKDTADAYATEFKKFNEWLLRQEGKKGDKQIAMFEDESMTNEPIEVENGLEGTNISGDSDMQDIEAKSDRIPENNSQDNNLEKVKSEERTATHGQAKSEETNSQDRILGKEQQAKRIGRRKKENGTRDYKINLYLTQSMADDIRALSALRGIDSLPEYIITVLSKEIEAKAEKLRLFRELKESERE